MANECYFTMRVVGKLKDIKELAVAMITDTRSLTTVKDELLKVVPIRGKRHLMGIYDIALDDLVEEKGKESIDYGDVCRYIQGKDEDEVAYIERDFGDNVVQADFTGSCRWSIATSLHNTGYYNSSLSSYVKTLEKEFNLVLHKFLSEESIFDYNTLINRIAEGVYDDQHEFSNILRESERLNLIIEIYSEEGGCGFQEHYLINFGVEEEGECRDWNDSYEDELDEEDPNYDPENEENNIVEVAASGGFPDWTFCIGIPDYYKR